MKHISVLDFKKVLEEKGDSMSVLCIDVRTVEEYANGHIDGVINVPLSTLESNLSLFDGMQRVFVQCERGGRSHQGAMLLESLGVLSQIYSVDGGFSAWKEAGFEVV